MSISVLERCGIFLMDDKTSGMVMSLASHWNC